MNSKEILISVVIPARNAQETLGKCLSALFSLDRRDVEVIIVDDNSDDLTSSIAERFPCTLLRLKGKRGPAAARNLGVSKSKGEIIVFIDSDIIIRPDTLSLMLEDFSADNKLAAVVGMLDVEIPNRNLASQFFNLRKHYDYLILEGHPSTMYTSISAIRKDVFLRVGGFNEEYDSATMEDAEFGRRLFNQGHKIKVNKQVRVVHLKYHSFSSLFASDFTRVSHYVKMLIRERLVADIAGRRRFGSFRGGGLVTVALAPFILILLSASYFNPYALPVLLLAILGFVKANIGFVRFTSGVIGFRMNLFMPALIFSDSMVLLAGIIYGIARYIGGDKY